MSQPHQPAESGDEFELLSTPPNAPDISGELKARKGAGPSVVTLSLVGVVLAVGGFLGGIAVQKSNGSSSSGKSTAAAGNPTSTRSRGASGGQFGGQNGTRGGTVTGTVQKVDGTTLTIVDATGKVTTVTTSDQTTVTVGKPGALTDLATGSQVTVVGTPDSSGAITARSVLSGIAIPGLGGTRGTRTPGATPGAPTSSPNG